VGCSGSSVAPNPAPPEVLGGPTPDTDPPAELVGPGDVLVGSVEAFVGSDPLTRRGRVILADCVTDAEPPPVDEGARPAADVPALGGGFRVLLETVLPGDAVAGEFAGESDGPAESSVSGRGPPFTESELS
jgi:hypothetical protein